MEIFYHDSSVLFDKFDLAHALEGDGKVKFGYGVYVTLREYPEGFVLGKRNAFVDKIHTEEVAAVLVENVVDWEGCGDTTTAVFLNEMGKIGLLSVVALSAEQVKAALEVAAAKASQCTQFYGSKGWLHAENESLACGRLPLAPTSDISLQ